MKFRDLGRFWGKVQYGSPLGCWRWRSYKDADGYGYFKAGGRAFRAHRLAYVLAGNDPIPAGGIIRHRCNHPDCCNPRHLVAGTHADNVADRVAAGRSASGEQNGRAKLKLADVRAIRAAQGKTTATALARWFGVSRSTISLIWQGKTWRETVHVA